jgi:hypothetical protein
MSEHDRTDDPEITLLALRIVDACLHDDGDGLNAALLACTGRTLPVLLSLAATAAELLRSAPGGQAWLQQLMVGLEVETISDSPSE